MPRLIARSRKQGAGSNILQNIFDTFRDIVFGGCVKAVEYLWARVGKVVVYTHRGFMLFGSLGKSTQFVPIVSRFNTLLFPQLIRFLSSVNDRLYTMYTGLMNTTTKYIYI